MLAAPDEKIPLKVEVEALKGRVLAFIGYFNRALAKPFKWTYKGRPLTV